MTESQNEQFKTELKVFLLETCRKKMAPEDLDNDAFLIGPDSALGLDSLDVIELSAGLMSRYGLRIIDSRDARKKMMSINALAHAIQNL